MTSGEKVFYTSIFEESTHVYMKSMKDHKWSQAQLSPKFHISVDSLINQFGLWPLFEQSASINAQRSPDGAIYPSVDYFIKSLQLHSRRETSR